MKFDIKKILALLMTVAMVAATVTFTAGNTLKAEDLQQGNEAEAESQVQELSKPAKKAAPAASKDNKKNETNPVEKTEEIVISEAFQETADSNGKKGKNGNNGNNGQDNANGNSNGQKEDNQNGIFIHLDGAVPQQSTVTIKDVVFAVQGSKLTSSVDVEFEQGDVVDVYSGEELIGTITIKEHGKAETGGKGNYWATFTVKTADVPPADQVENFSISVSAASVEGEYNQTPYSTTAVPSVSDGTTVYYSTDGGKTWTTEAPSRINAGTTEVRVKAENSRSKNKMAYCGYTITVTPKPVTVKAKAVSNIVYGEAMPSDFEADVTGLIGSDSVSYTVTCNPAGNGVGEYTVTPQGEPYQGNYRVTYEGTTFSVLQSGSMAINATGYTGTYDGNTHQGNVSVSVTEGTVVYYSTDGGETWKQEAPSIKDVGEINVTAKAVNSNYSTVTTEYTLKVTPKEITVTAPSCSLEYGDEIPAAADMTATVLGIIEGDSVDYTIKCNAGTSIGEYPIEFDNPQSAQGNYKITFVPGKLTIGPAGTVTVSAADYEGTYDGEGHSGTVTATEGATLEYSTDNGETWTATEPVFTGAGEHCYLVRGTREGYTSSEEISVTVIIAKKALVISSGSAEREYNQQPLTNSEVTVSGLVEGEYITLMATGSQTEIGSSDNTVEYAFGMIEGQTGTPAKKGNYYIDNINMGKLTVISVSATETPEPETTPDEGGGENGNGGNGNAVIATGTTPTGGATGGNGNVGNTAAAGTAGGTGGTAAAAAINADNGVELTQIAAEKTPLANSLLDANCCIFHLLIILAALIMLLWYMHDMKKRQKRIFQLEEELL